MHNIITQLMHFYTLLYTTFEITILKLCTILYSIYMFLGQYMCSCMTVSTKILKKNTLIWIQLVEVNALTVYYVLYIIIAYYNNILVQKDMQKYLKALDDQNILSSLLCFS